MEKGDFGKIRRAAKEWARNIAQEQGLDEPQAVHLREAFDNLRKLRRSEGQTLRTTIESLSKISSERERVGEDRYRLFEQVSEEVESKVMDANPHFATSLSAALSIPEEERSPETFEEICLFLDSSEEEIRNDPRMRAAFGGEEELLESMIRNQKDALKLYFQGMFGLSKSKDKLH